MTRPCWAEGYRELGIVLTELYQASTEERQLRHREGCRPAGEERHPHEPARAGHAPAGTRPVDPRGDLRDAPGARLPRPRGAGLPAGPAILPLTSRRPSSSWPPSTSCSRGPTRPVLIERLVRLSGTNAAPLALAGQLASQVRDFGLQARILRKQLAFVDADWIPRADLAATFLTPEQILSEVVPSGRYAVLFAERLYQAPEDRAVRERFLREGLRRLPADRAISEAARSTWRRGPGAGSGSRRPPRPWSRPCATRNAPWRKELVEWLIAWDKYEDAHGQALIGVALDARSSRGPQGPGAGLRRPGATGPLGRSPRVIRDVRLEPGRFDSSRREDATDEANPCREGQSWRISRGSGPPRIGFPDSPRRPGGDRSKINARSEGIRLASPGIPSYTECLILMDFGVGRVTGGSHTMSRSLFGLAVAVLGISLLASTNRAQAQAGNLGADPFSLYFGYYLPHQAAIAAQPTPMDTINAAQATRQAAAAADRTGLYEPPPRSARRTRIRCGPTPGAAGSGWCGRIPSRRAP